MTPGRCRPCDFPRDDGRRRWHGPRGGRIRAALVAIDRGAGEMQHHGWISAILDEIALYAERNALPDICRELTATAVRVDRMLETGARAGAADGAHGRQTTV